MKSQLPEQNNYAVRTSCKHCTFAVYDGKTQSECLHGRIEKFQSKDKDLITEAYDLEKNFYVVNKFCNFYRDKRTWNDGIPDENKVREEAKITFDILLNCDGIDNEYAEWITNFIQKCSNYGETKCFFHIYHASNFSKEQKKQILELCKNIKNYALNVYFDKEILEHGILSKSKRSYHIEILKDKRPSLSILESIDHLINNDLHKLLVIKNKDTYIYSNLSYKIESTSGESLNNIRNKIIEYSKDDFYLEIHDE
jgi:hypothetical protein